MNIGSYQGLIEFTAKESPAQFQGLKNCMLQINAICNCQKGRKRTKSEECNKMYVTLVNTVIPTMIEYFKTKTEDSDIIFTESGNHEIKRLKLR